MITAPEFRYRTDRLAEGVYTHRELCEVMDISPSMFYKYRSGRRPVSKKAFLKLLGEETTVLTCCALAKVLSPVIPWLKAAPAEASLPIGHAYADECPLTHLPNC